MIAPIVVAAIDGARVVWRAPRLRGWLVAVLLASSIISNIAWSNSPISDNHQVWARNTPRTEVMRRAVALVPDGVVVTATYRLTPHLTHRERIYDWPNPWVESYWGVDDGYRLPDPSVVEWIAIDRQNVSEQHVGVLEDLIATDGEFEVLLDESGILVARRRADG
jgi:hypothetical protein